MQIEWKLIPFKNLTVEDIYTILYVRMKVFVEEQKCVYVDMDFKDQDAEHLLGYANNELVAYCRLFEPGKKYENQASIGRVLVMQEYRKKNIGHELISTAIDYIYKLYGNAEIFISAQAHLKFFYEFHGFVQCGEQYLEVEIPHIPMTKNNIE